MRLFSRVSSNVILYVHPPGDNLLQGNKMHGRDAMMMPRMSGDSNYRLVKAEIATAKNLVRSKNHLPCHETGDVKHKDNQPDQADLEAAKANEQDMTSMHECILRFVELYDNCSLPFRSKNDSKVQYDRVCQNSTKFKNVYELYYATSEVEIYNVTGCYKPCRYFVSLRYSYIHLALYNYDVVTGVHVR